MHFHGPSLFSKIMLLLAAFFATIGYVSASPAPLALSHDDVILLDGSGKSQVMKAAELAALESRDSGAVESRESGTAALAPRAHHRRSGLARGCDESTEVQVFSDTMKLYPDVAISPVISGENLTLASVSVTQGYSLSNSVSIGRSSSLSAIKGVLTTTLSMTYTQSWTTSDSQTLSFNVPHNMFGVIVSQPYAREIQGNVLSGCTDSPTTTPFTSATYSSESYKDLSWVRGIVRLCTNESYPIPYCIGTGFHT